MTKKAKIIDTGSCKIVIKECGEYTAYKLLQKLHLSKYLPEIYYGNDNLIVYEYIEDVKPKDWMHVIKQLAYFIYVLEKNKIQHNDFFLGNILVNSKGELKVIDFETLVDYKSKKIWPNWVVNNSKKEMERMGWSSKFHPGSDLNQILGDISEITKLPSVLTDRIIKKKGKNEFPYAISQSNPLTTGKTILGLI